MRLTGVQARHPRMKHRDGAIGPLSGQTQLATDLFLPRTTILVYRAVTLGLGKVVLRIPVLQG